MPKTKGPVVTDDDRNCLWVLLKDGRFHKTRTLVNVSVNIGKDGDYRLHAIKRSRLVRAICEQTPGKFLSTQQGIKRVDLASNEDLRVASADLKSRARKMQERAEWLDEELYRREVPEQMRVCP